MVADGVSLKNFEEESDKSDLRTGTITKEAARRKGWEGKGRGNLGKGHFKYPWPGRRGGGAERGDAREGEMKGVGDYLE